MIATIKKNLALIVTGIVLAFASMTALAVAPVANAQDIRNNVCSGTDLSLSGNRNCASVTAGSESGLNTLITNIVNIFSLIVGIIAVIMIIIAGFKYITSGGDSNNVGSAKNTLVYAIVGLVIVALAQVIVRFVLDQTS